MPRQYNNVSDILEYDPRQQDEVFSMIYNNLQKKDEQFNQMSQLIPEAQALYESTPVSGADIPYLNKSVSALKNDLSGLVDKYGGDYGNARFRREALARISQTKTKASQLAQRNQAEQEYLKTIAPYRAAGTAIELDDFTKKSTFDENGNFQGIPDYMSNFRVRSDYDKTILEGLQGIDKMVKEGKLTPSQYGYLKQVTSKGLANLTEEDKDKIAKEFAPIFEKETTFGIDPKYKGSSSESYIREALPRLFSNQQQVQYNQDWLLRDSLKDGDKSDPFKNIERVPTENVETSWVKNVNRVITNQPSFFQKAKSLITGSDINYSDLNEEDKARVDHFVSYLPDEQQKLYNEVSNLDLNKNEIIDEEFEKAGTSLAFGKKREEILNRADKEYNRRLDLKKRMDRQLKSLVDGIEEEQQVGSYSISLKEIDKENPNFAREKVTNDLFGGDKTFGTGNIINRWIYDPKTGKTMTGTEFVKENIDTEKGTPVSVNGRLTIANPYYFITGNEDMSNGYEITTNGQHFIVSGEVPVGQKAIINELGKLFTEIRFMTPNTNVRWQLSEDPNDIAEIKYDSKSKKFKADYKDKSYESEVFEGVLKKLGFNLN